MLGLCRRFRWLAATTLVTVAIVVAVALPLGPVAASGDCWHPPVDGSVVDPFRAPACRWCAGNRGIEYRVEPGTPVRAVAGGDVAFAGRVVGRLYVVVRLADGRRVTYGLLAERAVSRGDRVVRGQRLGATAHSFHFGLRHHDEYVDPSPFLADVRGRPRLIPVDGTAARPAPPLRLRCRAATGAISSAPRRDLSVGAVLDAR